MRSVEFLDAVRARHRIPSDVKLAKFLDLEQGRISLYRTGRRTLDPETCIAVAGALELPPEYVLASVQAERAKRSEHRRIWERLAELAKRSNAAALVGFVAIGAGAPALMAALERAGQCIFCQIVRRWRFRVIRSTATYSRSLLGFQPAFSAPLPSSHAACDSSRNKGSTSPPSAWPSSRARIGRRSSAGSVVNGSRARSACCFA